VHNDTLDALTKRKRARGLHSYDAVVLDLLEQAPHVDPDGAQR
jgi:hypothetical protein